MWRPKYLLLNCQSSDRLPEQRSHCVLTHGSYTQTLTFVLALVKEDNRIIPSSLKNTKRKKENNSLG